MRLTAIREGPNDAATMGSERVMPRPRATSSHATTPDETSITGLMETPSLAAAEGHDAVAGEILPELRRVYSRCVGHGFVHELNGTHGRLERLERERDGVSGAELITSTHPALH